MCFDLNPESGAQLCLKAATVSLSSNHSEHLSPKPARPPPILKHITSTLTTINTAESGEWAGKNKTSA